MNRRRFFQGTAASALLALAGTPASAATPHVVIVGGGMAGASLAKFIRLWSNKAIKVTLIDTNSTYVSNIMSNLVLTGQVLRTALNYNYNTLVSKYGVTFKQGTVTGVTRSGAGWNVSLANVTLPIWADRVVLAPGVSFDAVGLCDANGNPIGTAPILHAWQAGPQTDALKAQLSRFPANGTYVMSIPKSPYRCPPGPYERACVIADFLKRKNIGAKVLVLDANASIQAEPENFGNAFTTLYGDMLTYVPNAVVTGVSYTGADPTGAGPTSSSAGTVFYDETPVGGTATSKSVAAALINVIPKHRAATIVQNVTPAVDGAARLADTGTQPFARVDARSFAAHDAVNFPGIHIIGDSHQVGGSAGGSGLPMAGHVANQEAKICAAALVAGLAAGPARDAEYLTANSACYSPISSTMASWLTVVYHYDQSYTGAPGQKQFWPSYKGAIIDALGKPYGPTEAASLSTSNFTKMNTWYKVLMKDSFA